MIKPNRLRVARQRTRQLDDVLKNSQVPQRPHGGWLSAVREALGMTKSQLARRMSIARPSLSRLESNEADDKITLASLKKVADVLGCDLQYVLVPRVPLAQMITDQALLVARKRMGRVNQSQALEASALELDSLSQAVVDLAKEIEMQRPADLWND